MSVTPTSAGDDSTFDPAMKPLRRNNLYVGNIANVTTSEELRMAFEPFGDVVSLKLMVNIKTGTPRGFGFVMFRTDSQAAAAISSAPSLILHGQQLAVRLADSRLPGNPTNRLFLRNLPSDYGSEAIMQLIASRPLPAGFSQPIQVLEVKCHDDDRHGHACASGGLSKMAHVTLATIEQAQMLTQLLDGDTLFVPGVPAPVQAKVVDRDTASGRLRSSAGAAGGRGDQETSTPRASSAAATPVPPLPVGTSPPMSPRVPIVIPPGTVSASQPTSGAPSAPRQFPSVPRHEEVPGTTPYGGVARVVSPPTAGTSFPNQQQQHQQQLPVQLHPGPPLPRPMHPIQGHSGVYQVPYQQHLHHHHHHHHYHHLHHGQPHSLSQVPNAMASGQQTVMPLAPLPAGMAPIPPSVLSSQPSSPGTSTGGMPTPPSGGAAHPGVNAAATLPQQQQQQPVVALYGTARPPAQPPLQHHHHHQHQHQQPSASRSGVQMPGGPLWTRSSSSSDANHHPLPPPPPPSM